MHGTPCAGPSRRGGQRGRGEPALVPCAPGGLGGDGPRAHVAAGDRRRRSPPGPGPTWSPPRRAARGPRLRLTLSHGWLSRVHDGVAAHYGDWVQPPRRDQGPSHAGCRCRPCSLRRGSRPYINGAWCRCATGGVRHLGPSTGAGGVRLADQHGMCRAPAPHHAPACRDVGRRVSTLGNEDGLQQQLALHHVSSQGCLPHASLRLPLPQLEPTHGRGSAKRWQPRPPAMAAGLTEHVWTLREVRRFRVPPWPQPAEG
jgi:hypothetical protein